MSATVTASPTRSTRSRLNPGRAAGLERAGRAVIANADRAWAAVAPRVFELHREGLTYDEIADRLRADGVVGRRGAAVSKAFVYRVLHRRPSADTGDTAPHPCLAR